MTAALAALKTIARPATRQGRTMIGWGRGAVAWASGTPARPPIVVGYGQRIPARNELAVGGLIKLQELRDAFAAAEYRFNVLYLVTSRLPDGAVALAHWARRKGARVVVNQNGVAYPAWYGPGWERVNTPMAQLLAMADYVFYQSAFCKVSADRFAGPRSGPWDVLYNAVDTRRFTPETGRSRDGESLTLLLGGSQDTWYRVDAALQVLALVAKRVAGVRMIVTGRLRWIHQPEEARRQIEARARELGVADRLVLHGPYAQQDAPAIYRRADILVHTKYNDPCPGVVIEAMASGLPVVYSRSGGVPELAGGDAGIGIEAPLSWEHDIPPDPAAMAEAVLVVAARLPEYSRAARQRAVEAFDIQHWLARHRAVFEAAA
jgi:glycosyltransferase involved in cell wall biosynthesis